MSEGHGANDPAYALIPAERLGLIHNRSARCMAQTTRGGRCSREAFRELPGIDLCDLHYRKVESYVDLRLTAIRSEWRARRREQEERTERQRDVYYVQRPDGAIKIGVTGRLTERLQALSQEAPVELLATHKGGRAAEAAMHNRFARYRLHGEWFEPAGELLEHIDRIRQRQGKSPLAGGQNPLGSGVTHVSTRAA